MKPALDDLTLNLERWCQKAILERPRIAHQMDCADHAMLGHVVQLFVDPLQGVQYRRACVPQLGATFNFSASVFTRVDHSYSGAQIGGDIGNIPGTIVHREAQ